MEITNAEKQEMGKYTIDQMVDFWCREHRGYTREATRNFLQSNMSLRSSVVRMMDSENKQKKAKIEELRVNKEYSENARRLLQGGDLMPLNNRMAKILDSISPKGQKLQLGQSLLFDYCAPRGQIIKCSLSLYSKGIVIVPGGFLPISEKFKISLPKDGWFQVGNDGLRAGPIPMILRGIAKIGGFRGNIQNGNFHMGPQDSMLSKIFSTIDQYIEGICLSSLREKYEKGDVSAIKYYMDRFNQKPADPQVALAWIKEKQNINLA